MTGPVDDKKSRLENKRFLKWLFIFLIIAGPAAFGSVHSWASLLLAGIVFLTLALMPDVLPQIKKLPVLWVITAGLTLSWLVAQSFLFSQNQFAATEELIRWLAVAVLFLMAQCLSKRSIEICLWVFILMGAVESVYGLYQVYSRHENVLWLEKGPHEGFVTGTYFNRNHLAGFLELSIGVQLGALLLAFREERLKRVLGLTLCLCLCVFSLFKTGSRAGMVSLAFASLISSCFLMGKVRKAPWGFLIYIVSFGALLLSASWQMITPRFMMIVEQSQTLDGRIIAWTNTLQMIGAYFWQGTGLGNFAWVFPQFQSERLFLGWDHAHQDYLELISEIGVPAFAVWIAGALGLWGYCLRNLSRLRSGLFPLIWGSCLGLTSLAIPGFTDFNFAVPANVILYFLLWGFVTRAIRLSEKVKKGGTGSGAAR